MDYSDIAWKQVILFVTTVHCFTNLMVSVIRSVDKSETTNQMHLLLCASGICTISCCYFVIGLGRSVA